MAARKAQRSGAESFGELGPEKKLSRSSGDGFQRRSATNRFQRRVQLWPFDKTDQRPDHGNHLTGAVIRETIDQISQAGHVRRYNFCRRILITVDRASRF